MCTNIQPIDVTDKSDIARVMISELEHVLSLVGPAKEEITQLQEQIVGRQVQPSSLVSENTEELKSHLENVKEENIKLQERLRRMENKETEYTNTLGKLQKEKKKTREIEASINTLKEKAIQRENSYKEAKLAYIEVNHDLENRLQAALKQLDENKNIPQQRQLNYEKEIRKMQQENAKLTTTLKQAKTEKATLEKDLSDTKSRLSKLMGDKLSDNNPDIADLSDNNRPTKLAEKYQELYDNQWTDAYEVAENKFPTESEETRIGVLLQILRHVYTNCKDEFDQQDRDFLQAMYRTDKTDESGFAYPDALKSQLKDLKRYSMVSGIESITQKYLKKCDKTTLFGKFDEQVETFVHECVTLCWFMVHQDPPLVFEQNVQKGDTFDGNKYKQYTATGTFIGFVVWPALLLHKDGPVLSKGIVQCVKSSNGSQSVRVRSQKVSASEMGIPTGSVRLTGSKASLDITTIFQDTNKDSQTGLNKTDANIDDNTIKHLQTLKMNDSSNSRPTGSMNLETFDQKCKGIPCDKIMSNRNQHLIEKRTEENATKHHQQQHTQPHHASENNRFPLNQQTDKKHALNQSAVSSFQQNEPFANIQQNQPNATYFQQSAANNSQQDHTVSFQQNQQTATNFQQSTVSNHQQDHTGRFQENHPIATYFQQPTASNFQQDHTRSLQQNQPTTTYAQQPTANNCQQDNTGSFQQPTATATRFQQALSNNVKQNYSTGGSCQESQGNYANLYQNQQTSWHFQQNQSSTGHSLTGQSDVVYMQQNQASHPTYHQDQPTSGNSKQNFSSDNTFAQSQSGSNQPYSSTQNSQVSSTGNQPLTIKQPTSYNISYPVQLIPTQDEYNIFLYWNRYFGNIEQARMQMGAQSYDKCTNYYRWFTTRQYN